MTDKIKKGTDCKSEAILLTHTVKNLVQYFTITWCHETKVERKVAIIRWRNLVPKLGALVES